MGEGNGFEQPGLISFRMGWLNLLAVQGTLKSLLQHHSSKVYLASVSSSSAIPFSIFPLKSSPAASSQHLTLPPNPNNNRGSNLPWPLHSPLQVSPPPPPSCLGAGGAPLIQSLRPVLQNPFPLVSLESCSISTKSSLSPVPSASPSPPALFSQLRSNPQMLRSEGNFHQPSLVPWAINIYFPPAVHPSARHPQWPSSQPEDTWDWLVLPSPPCCHEPDSRPCPLHRQADS